MEYKLIEFVQANPILYERKYKSSSKYTHQKKEKWSELAAILRKDPASLKLKWKNLRDTYRKSLVRKPRGSGDEEEVLETSSKWKFFNHLSFLRVQYENTKSDQSCDDTGDSELESSQYEQEDDSICNEEEEHTSAVDFEVENFDLNEYLKKFDAPPALTNSTSNQPETSTHSAEESQRQAKRKKLDKDSIINEACQEMSTLLQNAKQHFMPPSPNQVFFNSMALQVEQAKMPAMDLMRLQQRVLELVTQEIVLSQERSYHMSSS